MLDLSLADAPPLLSSEIHRRAHCDVLDPDGLIVGTPRMWTLADGSRDPNADAMI